MKSVQTVVLMFTWSISLSAMGVWDLSNTIGHPVATTESHAGRPWSDLTELHDSELHQHGISRPETLYPSGLPFDTLTPVTASTDNTRTMSAGHILPIESFDTDAYGKSVSEELEFVLSAIKTE